MLVSLRKNGLTSLFKEVRVLKVFYAFTKFCNILYFFKGVVKAFKVKILACKVQTFATVPLRSPC